MNSLFIVDDERSIREGLKYILDWESLGFKVCGEAGSCEEALNGLINLNPDLALLDVRMPRMTGTEILKQARAMGFTGNCIIISGYSDFTYAKEAIENGTSYYITKPVDEDELLNAVTNIRKEIDSNRARSQHLLNYKTKAKEVILKDLLLGNNPDKLSPEDLALLQLDCDEFMVVLCERFDTDISAPYLLSDLLRVSKSGNSSFEELTLDGYEVVLLKGKSGANRLNDLLDRFDEEPEAGSFLASLFITYGRPVNDISAIHDSFIEARELMGRRFFCPMDKHYMGYDELPSHDICANGSLSNESLKSFADSLKNYVQTYNHNEVADTLQAVKDYLVNVTNDISSIKMFLTDLYWQLKEQIIRIYPTENIPFPSPSSVISFFDKASYLYEIIRFMSEQCSLIMDATGNPTRDTILDDILYYIDHNFTGNIKLETIAPLFGYNSAYLGKIFNKEVGLSFNSYIDNRRIDASKKMLENNSSKVYEIAELVGYKNVDYFHKKFKKYVGISPQEYRKQFYKE